MCQSLTLINKETKQNINISNYLGMSQDDANFEQMIRIESNPIGSYYLPKKTPSGGKMQYSNTSLQSSK